MDVGAAVIDPRAETVRDAIGVVRLLGLRSGRAGDEERAGTFAVVHRELVSCHQLMSHGGRGSIPYEAALARADLTLNQLAAALREGAETNGALADMIADCRSVPKDRPFPHAELLALPDRLRHGDLPRHADQLEEVLSMAPLEPGTAEHAKAWNSARSIVETLPTLGIEADAALVALGSPPALSLHFVPPPDLRLHLARELLALTRLLWRWGTATGRRSVRALADSGRVMRDDLHHAEVTVDQRARDDAMVRFRDETKRLSRAVGDVQVVELFAWARRQK